ncbi:hypothetical protein GJ631_09495 [Natronomonas sp. CBA1123]|jgi:hypothetical protein|uniref:iron transporter n=1 Tax=Natronomonas sp. CBA1123 TaxID=2668070 RepID=UPI0012EA3164|nr:iron transporter [Natronomonas sp. CBA1123]MUV86790.1 hypothetical protein [Natronomonas sp. CBA1123]
MLRRGFLAAATTAVTASGSGCLGGLSSGSIQVPEPLSDRPDAVYRPTHASGARTVKTATVGDYGVGLLYSYPSRFWDLNGRTTYRRSVETDDSVHLMAVVWDAETKTVLPEAGVTAEIRRDGDIVTEGVVYSMISQRMGFHYGDNVALPGEDTYTVEITVGGMPLRKTGAFEGRFDEGETVDFEFDYRPEDRETLPFKTYDDAGRHGALSPSPTDEVPASTVPPASALPGETLGTVQTSDAVLTVLRLTGEAAARFDTDRYLTVLAHTPYNRIPLPMMGLRMRQRRGGSRFDERILTRTMDPELGYHYGAAVDAVGEEIAFETMTPPQLARHEGYETAFVRMPTKTLRP